jgi:oligopeptidase A
MPKHPFLDLDNLPAWSELSPDLIKSEISNALERSEERLQKIRSLSPQESNFNNSVKALEQATIYLDHAWGLVGHLDSVCNSPELRTAHNEMLPKVSAFGAKIPLDKKLWQVIRRFSEKPEVQDLSPIDHRLLEETIADFQESGADLPTEKKDRLEKISSELAQATQQFSERVLDATNSWKLVVNEESRLSGLPQSAKEAARATAIEKLGEEEGKKSWIFTLHAPSLVPALQYLDEDELRKEIWTASDALGSEKPYDNQSLIATILKLRQEKAELLGKSDFSEVALSRRMAKSGERADDFISELRDQTAPFFQLENQELESYKAEKTGKNSDLLQPWEVGYWSEKLKKERYDFDEEDLRPYFPIHSVLQGMFALVTKVFGLRIVERSTLFEGEVHAHGEENNQAIEVWHPDVRFYDLFDSECGQLLGSFYADWHPRSSKRAGAWMNYLKTGEPRKNGERAPHLGLICGNLTAPTPGKPALLTHYEVETIFHEFGHLLHHLCGEVPHRSLNGVNVAWDFVELPSQIMENWCWERESLDLFAKHHESNDSIPNELFAKMIRAKNFMAGNAMMRQLAFSKLDLVMHRTLAQNLPQDLESSLQDILHDYLPKRKTKPRTIALRFSHLFGSPMGYATAYYSYKWAEVLDADAFTRFQKEGVMNPATGRSFRKSILSQGNSRPPEELFKEFMGRPPQSTALLKRSGLSPTTQ